MTGLRMHTQMGNRALLQRKLFVVIAFLLSILAWTHRASAQETRATLSGTITEVTGGALPNVTLTLANRNTGTSATVQSNSEGQYRFLFIDPGTYSLSADATGFAKYVQQGLTLNVSQASTIDIRMVVGSAE